MLQYIAIYCNKQYIDIFIRCIVLYCSSRYCNISIYCNIVASLVRTISRYHPVVRTISRYHLKSYSYVHTKDNKATSCYYIKKDFICSHVTVYKILPFWFLNAL